MRIFREIFPIVVIFIGVENMFSIVGLCIFPLILFFMVSSGRCSRQNIHRPAGKGTHR